MQQSAQCWGCIEGECMSLLWMIRWWFSASPHWLSISFLCFSHEILINQAAPGTALFFDKNYNKMGVFSLGSYLMGINSITTLLAFSYKTCVSTMDGSCYSNFLFETPCFFIWNVLSTHITQRNSLVRATSIFMKMHGFWLNEYPFSHSWNCHFPSLYSQCEICVFIWKILFSYEIVFAGFFPPSNVFCCIWFCFTQG